MNAEKWQKVKSILEEAVEIAPAARAEYLEKACASDEDLRLEVESLLDFDNTKADVLEQSAFSVVMQMDENSAAQNFIGRQIGNYKIVGELGAGGMGAVFLAERSDGAFEQKAALKLIKRGMDSDAILRRFFNERQILASLKHPNIAHLIDGGTTDDGLPYFVLEYVEGETITDFVERENLDIEARLKIFRQICEAVSFAHSNLVIHRDLKPSNILVTEDGNAKLLDFGIAKLLKSDADSAITGTQNFVFTPEYASPEQVRGEKLTTATDVYSLGVILYELLTGNRPYKTDGKNISDIIRAVCETEPERPSSVVSHSMQFENGEDTNKNKQQTTEKGKKTNLKSKIQNPKSLKGDLDNIILKALRKEPERRYSSVEQFSEDVRRHQIGLPVSASKDTWSYRAAKFAQRNRVAAVAAVLILLTLLGGLATTYYQARIARAERAKAERRFNEVRQLAKTVLFDYHDAIAALPGSTAVRERLIKDSLGYLDNLAGEAAGDPALQREISAAYLKIGDVQGGISTTSSGTTLSSSSVGDTQGAFESYGKALAINEQLIQLAPDDKELGQDLAKCYSRMAEINVSMGKLEAAVDFYRRAITTFEKLFAADPSNKYVRVGLGSFYFVLGNTLGVPGSPNLGRPQEALEQLGKAAAFDESLLAEEPNNLNYRQALGSRYGNIGRIHYGSENYSEALIYYRKALETGEQLVRADATNALFRRELAVQYRNVANALLATGDKSGAIEHLRQAISLFENLMAADAKDTRIRRSAAYGYRDLGIALSAADQPDEALKNLDTALNIFTELSAQDAKNAVVKQQIAITRLKLSEFFIKRGDAALATENARQSINVGEALITDGVQDVDLQKTLADARAQLGDCFMRAAEKSEANQSKNLRQDAQSQYQKSLDGWEALRSQNKLSGSEAGKPDQIRQKLAQSDTLVAK